MRVGGIFFLRENAPETRRCVNIGTLYTQDNGLVSICLQSIRIGLCGARASLDAPPFIEGDIMCGETYVGYVTTSATRTGEDIYSIVIEAIPLRNKRATGDLWLTVVPPGSPRYKETHESTATA